MLCLSCSISFAGDEADYQAWKSAREKESAWRERERAEYNKKVIEELKKHTQKQLENEKKQAIENREALRRKYAGKTTEEISEIFAHTKALEEKNNQVP
jgi:hypothetical protein